MAIIVFVALSMNHINDLIKDLERLYAERPTPIREAFRIQKHLSRMVVGTVESKRIDAIAGADIAVCAGRKKLICGIILFSYPEMEEIERVWTVSNEVFPYVSGTSGFQRSSVRYKNV